MIFRLLNLTDEPDFFKVQILIEGLALWSGDEWHTSILQGRVMGAFDHSKDGTGELLAFSVILPMGEGEAEILQLGTHPKARRRGLMRDLILRTVNHFHVKTLHLEVRAGNEPAQKLYNAIGLSPVGRRPGYYADGEDAILYSGSFGLA